MYQLQNLPFPKDFIFGAADADLQVIGEQHTLKNENSEPTAWTKFAKTSGKVFQNHTPLEGIDRFHKWKEDIAIMKSLGIKHYRTSISMARTMHENKKPNVKALEWYKRFFQELRKNDIAIYVTLYHWELPEYLSKIGGWKNRKIIEYFTEHAKIVQKYLGEFCEEYFILNEPFQFTFDSYYTGWNAPGEKSLKSALATVHHALLAQGTAFRTLKQVDKKAKISTVYNPTITYAASSSSKDIQAALYAFGYKSTIFTDPTYKGSYPDYMLELFGNKMPKIAKDDMEIIKIGDQLTSLGINFYRGQVIQSDENAELKFAEVKFPQAITNGLDWPVSLPPTYPEAFYDLLCKMYDMYQSYGLKKLYITENGTCWNDTVEKNGQVNDEFRIFYFREHLAQVQKAILAGVPVKGYFVWTLMDNFEWEYGYKPGSNFGIVYVDRKTMKRIPKKSFYWYKKLVETGKLE